MIFEKCLKPNVLATFLGPTSHFPYKTNEILTFWASEWLPGSPGLLPWLGSPGLAILGCSPGMASLGGARGRVRGTPKRAPAYQMGSGTVKWTNLMNKFKGK